MLGEIRRSPWPISEVVLTLSIFTMVALMVVPVPTGVLDLLLAANLGFAALVLVGAISHPAGPRFGVLPSLLLIATLYRLSLNISSTRLILTQADAGRIIDTFGSWVILDSLVVGAVIFLVLTLVQFLVITRGAERVAEVSARFSLDAMPGLQLSIDAERRQGEISAQEARRRRDALAAESHFLGSMDGAMRFIKGDAIAALVITGLNLIVGTGIGVFQNGLNLIDALSLYGRLTIGDGLVSQTPAILIALAAGLVVTHGARTPQSGLAEGLARELLSKRRSVILVALFLLILGIIPGLPLVPFALLAFCLLGLAALHAKSFTPESQKPFDPSGLSLEVHPSLLEENAVPGGPLEAQWVTLAQSLALRWGSPLPFDKPKPNPRLPPGMARLSGGGLRSGLIPLHDDRDLPRRLEPELRPLLAAFFRVADTERLLSRLASTDPTLESAARRAVPNIVHMTEALRLLLADGLRLEPTHLIAEAFAKHGEVNTTPGKLHRAARRALGPHLVASHLGADGILEHLSLCPFVEEELKRGFDHTEGLAIAPHLWREVQGAIEAAHDRHPASVLVVASDLRRAVQDLVWESTPSLPVLGWDELPRRTALRRAEEVTPPELGSSALGADP